MLLLLLLQLLLCRPTLNHYLHAGTQARIEAGMNWLRHLACCGAAESQRRPRGQQKYVPHDAVSCASPRSGYCQPTEGPVSQCSTPEEEDGVDHLKPARPGGEEEALLRSAAEHEHAQVFCIGEYGSARC